ncbi:MAG: hypothetical protein IKW59_04645 [Clostridia bacterium]|nr:hypothetical protein [Clostridia bacterium]
MFGYVRICKDELKVREYNLFRSYYCGLCKSLKKEYGFASRMGLSYDVTFLALLLSSICDENTKFLPERCIVSPHRKKPIAKNTDALSYSADVNVILTYAKLKDDWHDEHSFKALLCLPLFFGAKRKIKKKNPELLEKVQLHLANLSEFEREKCAETDRLANEFGEILKEIFYASPNTDETQKRILSHIGYGIGRFIYIMDAYEDIEKDKKEKSFNPFLLSGDAISAEEVRESLMFTLSEISNSYQLLNIKRNKPIIDNIIYLGLSESLEKVFNTDKTKEKEINERSI